MECPRCQRTLDPKTRRCAWCGVNALPGQHLLEESGVVVPIRPEPTESSPSQRSRLATLGDRLIALLLDRVAVLIVCAVIDVWAFTKWGIVSGTELRITTAVVVVSASFNLLIAFLYLCLLEASFGCTLGKAIIGIGVVNNSQRSALAASAIRNAMRLVDGVGFYLIGTLVATCSRFRRRIGDLCGGTYVVEGNLPEFARALSVVAWVAILAAGAWALPNVWSLPKPSHAPRHLGRVVMRMGRIDNSYYLRVPNREIDLSLSGGNSGRASHAASENAAATTSKLQAAPTSSVTP